MTFTFQSCEAEHLHPKLSLTDRKKWRIPPETSSGHQGLVPRGRQGERLLFAGADAKAAPPAVKSLTSAASLTTSASIDHGWMPDLEPSVMNRRLLFDFLLDFMVSPVT